MGQLKADRRSGATGAGRRIYELLRSQIADGTLVQGARAPSTRALAAELGVSRTTVTSAYEQLASEGFLVTSSGRAARIAAPLAQPKARHKARKTASTLLVSAFAQRLAAMDMPALAEAEPARFDFRYGVLASRDFPVLAWRRAYQDELLRQQANLDYVPPEGERALRVALQAYLRRARGLVCDAEQVLVVHGSQQAIDLCARLLLDANDAFVIEDPGYLMARRSFEATGASCLAVPVDVDGLDTDQLPDEQRTRLAYVTPSHQFPLGGVLPIARRLALLQWAQRHGTWIVEDDYDGEFRYGQRPIDALQSIDGDERVIYVGTFSKSLSPQLRLGYMVLPPALVPLFRQAKRLTDRHAPVMEQRALAALIESGSYERHIRRMRREYERRRSALLAAISRCLPSAVHVSGTAAGLHFVLWLPMIKAGDEAKLIDAARKAGVGIYPVTPLFAKRHGSSFPGSVGLIMGYASLTIAQIEQGMDILASVIAAMAPA